MFLTAVMFTPQAVWAHEFLAGKKDPPKSIHWGPTESWVSCDGRTAINRGVWATPAGKWSGYFTTVWQRQRDRSWKWTYDAGDELTREGEPVTHLLPGMHQEVGRGSQTTGKLLLDEALLGCSPVSHLFGQLLLVA